jgi:protein translocase SecG subunit
MVMVVLVQRGRGGGLAGAFGAGGGSSSAFGTKTGDVFTTLTVVTFVVFILLAILLSFRYKHNSAPSAPANLKPEEIQPGIVTLTWDDTSDTEERFKVYRAEGGGAGMAFKPADENVPANPGIGKMTWQDKNVAPGTKYTYRVESHNQLGSRYSQDKEILTKGEPRTQPAILAPETTTSAPAPATAPATAPSTLPATTTAPASAPAAPTSSTAPATRP